VDRAYAAGDVTSGSNGLQQIITAASEGAIAIKSIFDDIERSKVTLWKKD
jgi:thioredoxin reductase